MAALAVGWPCERGLFCQVYSIVWSAFIARRSGWDAGLHWIGYPAKGLLLTQIRYIL